MNHCWPNDMRMRSQSVQNLAKIAAVRTELILSADKMTCFNAWIREPRQSLRQHRFQPSSEQSIVVVKAAQVGLKGRLHLREGAIPLAFANEAVAYFKIHKRHVIVVAGERLHSSHVPECGHCGIEFLVEQEEARLPQVDKIA